MPLPPPSPPRQDAKADPKNNNALTTTTTAAAASTARSNNVLNIELTARQRAELREAFNLFDSEGTGRIPSMEVKVALRALGFEVRKEELRQLLAEAGCNTNGTMDFNEFIRVLSMKMGEKETKADVQRAFKMFDVSDKGHISLEDIKDVADLLEYPMTEEELKEMMEFAKPKNGVGAESKATRSGASDNLHVTEDDFLRLMKRSNVF